MFEVQNVTDGRAYTRTATGVVILSHDHSQVLLITSLKFENQWVLPKGGLEPGLTAQENALKECGEEAGAVVQLHDQVYDNVLFYPESGTHPEKIQREIYFRAEFISWAQQWEEYDRRKRQWRPIGPELKMLLAPHQYEAVINAQQQAVIADEVARQLADRDEDLAD